MSSFGITKVSFAGANASGSAQDIKVAGVLAGDILISVYDQNGNGVPISVFAGVCASDGVVRQNQDDLSLLMFTAVFARFG